MLSISFSFFMALMSKPMVVTLPPEYWDAYYNRGKAVEGLGNYRKAIEDFYKTIEINPEFDEAYYNLGVIYDSNFNNYREAIKNYS